MENTYTLHAVVRIFPHLCWDHLDVPMHVLEAERVSLRSRTCWLVDVSTTRANPFFDSVSFGGWNKAIADGVPVTIGHVLTGLRDEVRSTSRVCTAVALVKLNKDSHQLL